MRALPFATLFALCALCGVSGGADPGTGEDPDDIGAEELAFIRGRLDCDGAEAADCAALDRFAQGSPPELPATVSVRLGRCRMFASHFETAAYMTAGPDGLATGEITPDNAEEAAQIAAVVETLRGGGSVAQDDPVLAYSRPLATSMSRQYSRVEGRSRVYGQAERVHFRATGDGEWIAVTVTDDGPRRVAIFR